MRTIIGTTVVSLLLVVLSSSFQQSNSKKNYWTILEKIEWTTAVDAAELLYLKPKYSKRVQRLEGKRIVLEGYIQKENNHWVLKRYLSSRGQYHDTPPGISEVIRLSFKQPISLSNTISGTVKGRLKLHRKVQDNTIYSLENVVLIE